MGFHWHGDVFDLPAEAVPLASSERTECQAFRYSRNAYGLLFHMEITAQIIRSWAEAFSHEIAETGQSALELVDRSEVCLEPLQRIGHTIYERWACLAANCD